MKEETRNIIVLDEGVDLRDVGPMALCCTVTLIPIRR